MGERIKHSPGFEKNPRQKRNTREIQSVDYIEPTNFSKEQVEELLSSIWVKKLPDARGGTRWEIISLITTKNERQREIRKTRDGAIRRALDRAKPSHKQILIKDVDGSIVERILLE